MAAPLVPNYNNLGNPVSSTQRSWNDLAVRAWGGEWNAPDHNMYVFSNGRGFDSTDTGSTGLYTKFVEPSEFTLDLSLLDSTSILG